MNPFNDLLQKQSCKQILKHTVILLQKWTRTVNNAILLIWFHTLDFEKQVL